MYAKLVEKLNDARLARNKFDTGMFSMIVGEVQRHVPDTSDRVVTKVIDGLRSSITGRIDANYNKYDHDLAVSELAFLNKHFPVKELRVLSEDECGNLILSIMDTFSQEQGMTRDNLHVSNMKNIITAVREHMAQNDIQFDGAFVSKFVRQQLC